MAAPTRVPLSRLARARGDPPPWRCTACGCPCPGRCIRCAGCGKVRDQAHPSWQHRGDAAQALVEFALVFPIMMAMLLGIIGAGLLFVGAAQQQAATGTIAGWVAQHPTEDPAPFVARLTACPAVVTVADHVATVTLDCPSLAGELVPALPPTITTTATAYVAAGDVAGASASPEVTP